MKLVPFILALLFCGLLEAAEAFSLTPKPGETEFTVTAPAPGVYRFRVRSRAYGPAGREHTAVFRWEEGARRQRRLLHPNRKEALYEIDRLVFGAEPRRLRVEWNPEEVELLEFRFSPDRPEPVPEAAQNYRPPFAPPARHPRLLVNPSELEKIRANLETGVNQEVWQKLAEAARKPYLFAPSPDTEVMYDPAVAAAISGQAFYHLVTGDREAGRAAVELALTYLDGVSFGNGQDICRKVGEIIFRASQVYDWCYALMTPEERARMRERMLWFAGEMEIGWPPFHQSVASGHGNEAQMSRDLLAMAIAVYDEDPQPFQYAAYTMLEVLRPMKEFLFRSGRHDQGSGYGAYRLRYDFAAALHFRRTFGVELLPPETALIPYYWHYLRTPDNRILVEGDANWDWSHRYRVNREMLLNHQALWPDPELKEEYRRNHPKLDFPEDPVWFLLLNDPKLAPEDRRASLPLVKFYRDPLPGMALRTGWNFGRSSDDVVVTLQGAQYHLRNHQHLDMGSFQIYYRGNLAADLGQYRTYGLPYDWNFAKSSASHSVMLFRDPEESKRLMGPVFTANSGTQEVRGWWPPDDLKQLLKDDTFRSGDTPRAGWGPDREKPAYAFMECDLGRLHPGRVKSYSRSFVYLNLGRKDTPAALLVLDRFEKTTERVEPVFQLTAIGTPVEKEGVLEVAVSPYGRTGKLSLRTLLPEAAARRILTGKEVFMLGGQFFAPGAPKAPEASGSRAEITGSGGSYLHLIEIQDGAAVPLPARCREEKGRIRVEWADRLIGFGDALRPSREAVRWEVTAPGTQVLLLDLAPGPWKLLRNGTAFLSAEVPEGEGSFFTILEPGSYELIPACETGE